MATQLIYDYDALVPRKQRPEIQEKIFCLVQRWPEYKGTCLVYPVEGSGWLLNYMIKELEK